ncbi:hypothetical protein N7492_009892 [Penicillium capsulatum]|uniref:Uncharacterized protein n=1 Tax=Penicillium capsulatum TaxID=69766 RepID=A0A9W9LER7_9EURO|nr:hypothetical protein N7492_009892 [Penicillium capsulatum]KAJ6112403.1 hypothetical protein N7512_007727 [Penicillium capsulatum]
MVQALARLSHDLHDFVIYRRTALLLLLESQASEGVMIVPGWIGPTHVAELETAFGVGHIRFVTRIGLWVWMRARARRWRRVSASEGGQVEVDVVDVPAAPFCTRRDLDPGEDCPTEIGKHLQVALVEPFLPLVYRTPELDLLTDAKHAVGIMTILLLAGLSRIPTLGMLAAPLRLPGDVLVVDDFEGAIFMLDGAGTALSRRGLEDRVLADVVLVEFHGDIPRFNFT